MALETKTAPQPIYRIGRQPDAWQPPDWSRATDDGTFGNRFDDPESYYRVLYGSSHEVCCFVETLARYRPGVSLLAELDAIEGENDFFPLGTVPSEWCSNRALGTAFAEGEYADICGGEWITFLRRRLASECLRLRIPDLDASVLQSGSSRRITQLVSRIAYERTIPVSTIGPDTPSLSRTGHCLNRFGLVRRPPYDLTTTVLHCTRHSVFSDLDWHRQRLSGLTDERVRCGAGDEAALARPARSCAVGLWKT